MYSIVLSSMMLFKRSFGLTRSLFIDMFRNTIAKALGCYLPGVNCGNSCITFVYFNSSNCDRKSQSYPVEYYLESVEEYSEGNIHMSEPESGKRKCKYRVLC